MESVGKNSIAHTPVTLHTSTQYTHTNGRTMDKQHSKHITNKPTVCVDFNGVLDTYAGWVKDGNGAEYPPRPGVQTFLEVLHQQYVVVVCTAIEPVHVIWWLSKHNLDMYVDDVTNIKPPAVAYIDDRAIRFDGNFQECLDALQGFQPYWRK